MDRTPEEFPNDIKYPYNQWETPLELFSRPYLELNNFILYGKKYQ